MRQQPAQPPAPYLWGGPPSSATSGLGGLIFLSLSFLQRRMDWLHGFTRLCAGFNKQSLAEYAAQSLAPGKNLMCTSITSITGLTSISSPSPSQSSFPLFHHPAAASILPQHMLMIPEVRWLSKTAPQAERTAEGWRAKLSHHPRCKLSESFLHREQPSHTNCWSQIRMDHGVYISLFHFLVFLCFTLAMSVFCNKPLAGMLVLRYTICWAFLSTYWIQARFQAKQQIEDWLGEGLFTPEA